MNEFRRNTTNDSLAKRAKELLKKWRSMVLPESNGQLQERKRPAKDTTTTITTTTSNNKTSAMVENSSTTATAMMSMTGVVPPKRSRVNGQATSEFDFSDNSNSSFKDVIGEMIIIIEVSGEMVQMKFQKLYFFL